MRAKAAGCAAAFPTTSRSPRCRMGPRAPRGLAYAARMLRLNDELLGRFDNAREGIVLRVGIPNDFSVAMLPMALSRFAASEPGVILDLQSDLSISLLEGLRTGQFDLV